MVDSDDECDVGLKGVFGWPDAIMVIHSYYERRVSSQGWSLFCWSIYGIGHDAARYGLASSCLGISGNFGTSNVDADRTEHVDGSHSVKHY